MYDIIIAALIAVVCLVGGFFAGVFYRKKVGEAEIGSAEEKAKSIIDEAMKVG